MTPICPSGDHSQAIFMPLTPGVALGNACRVVPWEPTLRGSGYARRRVYPTPRPYPGRPAGAVLTTHRSPFEISAPSSVAFSPELGPRVLCRGPFCWLERTPLAARCNGVRQYWNSLRCRAVEPRQGCPLGGVPLFRIRGAISWPTIGKT
jgi:hypothetical protein